MGGRTPPPVLAVGEGAVRRALRSPGYAAESGTRGSRATGIPGRVASEANEFQATGAGTAPGSSSPGTLERPWPGNLGNRGWTPSNASVSELGGSSGFAPDSAGGRNNSGASELRGQVRKGVTLPFPVPDPIVSVACGPG